MFPYQGDTLNQFAEVDIMVGCDTFWDWEATWETGRLLSDDA
jgi:hypothetical protein